MADEPARTGGTIGFGGDFELDARSYELRRSGRAVRLERIPMEVLLLLAERKGQLVTREQIAERIWGREVFLDTDNSINGAVRKLRQALKDDPEKPRIIQTVTGKGYRFVAPVVDRAAGDVSRSPVPVFPSASSDVSPSASPDVSPSAGPEQRLEAKEEKLNAKSLSRRWPILLALALGLIASLAIYLEGSRARPGPAGGRRTLAVLPFENLTGDPAQDYFSDGLTEEMISRLGNLAPVLVGAGPGLCLLHNREGVACFRGATAGRSRQCPR